MEDFSNELWQKYQLIWFSPFHPRIWEATAEDELAVKENKLVASKIDSIPDVDPLRQETNGTLIQLISKNGTVSLADGQMRQSIIDALRKEPS